jgi:ABC-2 type transport system ATP-binding protein
MIQSASSQLAIDLSHVEKIYKGRVYALQGVNMRVHRGEVFGLLGPNGAGKSTLVKIMMTVVRPTRCEGSLLGNPIGHKPTLSRVGYLPENHRFPRYLTGRQTLDFLGALSKTPRKARHRRTEELLDVVGMRDWADRKVSVYSKGMMQRIGLAQALVHDPDLVLLDEPTDGVDPVGRREIRDVILNMKHRGKTIFINSHLLSELEMISDRVAILVGGRVATQGTIDELAIAKQYYAIELAEAPDPALLESLRRSVSEGISVELKGKSLEIGTIDAAAVQPAIDTLRSAGAVIKRVHLFRPSLEDLFIEAVGSGRNGAGVPVGARPISAGGAA